MTDDATPAKVRLTDGLGPLPPKTALGWDYGYTELQMREYAAGEVARATATMNACLLQMQEAAKDLAAKATVLAPYRKPYARDAFEAWASDAYKWPNAIERSGEGYRLMQTHASWEAWSMAWGSAEVACAERIREVGERCSAWADIAGAHGAEVDRLRALLREVSASRWECATEDGACPDCGADDGEPHDAGCLLGQVDAECDKGPNAELTGAPLR